jgi:hypothetical protein
VFAASHRNIRILSSKLKRRSGGMVGNLYSRRSLGGKGRLRRCSQAIHAVNRR